MVAAFSGDHIGTMLVYADLCCCIVPISQVKSVSGTCSCALGLIAQDAFKSCSAAAACRSAHLEHVVLFNEFSFVLFA